MEMEGIMASTSSEPGEINPGSWDRLSWLFRFDIYIFVNFKQLKQLQIVMIPQKVSTIHA